MRSDPILFASRAMEELLAELRVFLELLDREYLTAGVREKKQQILNILHRVLATREPSCKTEIHTSLPAPPQMPLPEIPHPWMPPDNGPPPLPSSSLPEGYYEEAVPLSPGKAPEYITSNYDSDAMSSSYESYDEEEEDGKGQKMHHQWPSEEASMDLVKDARICAFLLRKKRFGQWTKLLCVIKDNKLLCYKSSKDQTPQMELLLSGCSITHIPKDGKKKKHELKIVHQGADALVLAVQSKEQAEEWLKSLFDKFSPCSSSVLILWTGLGKFHLLSFFIPSFFFLLYFWSFNSPLPLAGMVMKEVCSNGNGVVDCDGNGSGSPVHKAELEKKLSCDRPSSDGEPCHENGISDGKDPAKGKKNSKSEQKGTVGRVTGKKITKIISLGKKKPSTDEQTSSAEEDVPTCGYLNVLSNNRWRERWCQLKDNQLLLHKDRADLKTHMASLPLRGCEVIPGLDSKHPFAFRLLRNGQEVAVLEASSSESMGRWLGVLLAETGSTTDPAALHYDYIDVETTANVIQLAKQSFCFTSKRAVSPNRYLDNPVNGYACPTGVALHYDDVPCINGSLKGKKGLITNGFAAKQKLDKNQPKKANGFSSTLPVKHNNSSVDQYKYGKNRVEADAKKLQAKEDELMKRKQEIRTRLAQLKKDRKDLRTAIENNTGKRSQASLTEKLKKVEDECKLKEEERVNLELELTEVKESLKKALNGGVTLGLTIEPKTGSSSPQSPVSMRRTVDNSPISSCDTSDTETCSLPVNSASLLRRQTQQKASPVRGHVLRKAKEWEMKSGT
ncbi:actin filament-associated protein 1-like isoform X4 [Cyprinus carpio]|uniref:Actin filament-associated protein 1 n=2 Tax=Cyprinus carpio TaxID=7962 RepID=A0A9R0B665_CYPCA|nr:actin filament-associated protein 1-like isoform X4 [Cyprinus carpio]